MNIDHFCEIGASHKICDDCVHSEKINNTGVVIVSDGCSAVVNSDIGSRILVHSAAQSLRSLLTLDPIEPIVINNSWQEKILLSTFSLATNIVKQLGLSEECLAATLIVSIVSDKKAHVFVYGDGAFFVRIKKDFQQLEDIIKIFHYSNEAPYYPLFEYNPQMKLSYENGCQMSLKKPILSTTTLIVKGELEEQTIEQELAVSMKHKYFEFDNIGCISIASDGVGSFINTSCREIRSIDPLVVIKNMTAYKKLHGEFVKRRMSFLQEWANNKIVHVDDLSVASIVLEGE